MIRAFMFLVFCPVFIPAQRTFHLRATIYNLLLINTLQNIFGFLFKLLFKYSVRFCHNSVRLRTEKTGLFDGMTP